MAWTQLETPIGRLQVESDGESIIALHFNGALDDSQRDDSMSLLATAAMQLQQYFSGERNSFDLPLLASGSEFQKRVWTALQEIPFGETRSYKQLAEAIGDPAASRAVGSANGANPIPVIIPCHRVIAADGSLGGYSGGLEIKQRLLEIERAMPQGRLL
ncbi:MAG: methylated-DNA--[protein]-cysteine S-methyltransferase [Gammaproteobacteria bacterium]|nr:methylated-DNA--[protein]-cysteine S-methyltransferase [Gammaproteobacteria bacterium]